MDLTAGNCGCKTAGDIEISEQQFTDFKQKKNMEVIYVDQFDDKLWKDFSIIEPTEQMREYRKQY